MKVTLRQTNLNEYAYEEQHVSIRRDGSNIVFEGGYDSDGIGLNFGELKRVIALLEGEVD